MRRTLSVPEDKKENLNAELTEYTKKTKFKK